ncbi:MAG TPA: hypothetical protein VJ417_04985, partial [Candidatus Glassbacteria bacterium]|nr:hypothetical protein [Candidatus Glassbacteria bacterium]
DDPRLFCDPGGKVTAGAKTTVQLAREMSQKMIAGLDQEPAGNGLLQFVGDLTRPPDSEPHNLMPELFGSEELDFARLEKVYFNSEDGQYVPGLLWLPKGTSPQPRRVALIVDDRGKAQVARSGLVQPLVAKGLAVLSVDLRGRGETLGPVNEGRDNNYQFAWHSVLWGLPAAGRRAFDLTRALDYIGQRQDLTLEGITVVGLRDEALAVLLAAAVDKRIGSVICADYLASFRSQQVSAAVKSREEFIQRWNSQAIDWGRIAGREIEEEIGDVLPGVLEFGDLPEIAALAAPRRLIYLGTRDNGLASAGPVNERFRRVTARAGAGWFIFQPERPLTPDNIAGLLGLK